MNFSKLENDFYNEVIDNIIHFSRNAIKDLKKQSDTQFRSKGYQEALAELQKINFSDVEYKALEKIIQQSIEGAVHSIFVSIDGGTALSNEGKALELIDYKTGKPLTDGGLHENFLYNMTDDLV